MPYSGVPSDLTKKMERCVSEVMKQGKSKSSAIAICKARIAPKKDFSFTERARIVRYAFEAMYGEQEPWLYAGGIYTDYLITTYMGKHIKVPYDWNNGEPIIAGVEDWSVVEIEYIETQPMARKVVGRPIKATETPGGNLVYKAYGVLFGGPDQRDLENQYFTKDTDFHLDWHSDRPWLHHHGIHPMVGPRKVGMWKDADIDDEGVFFIGEMDRYFEYAEALQTLLDAKVCKPSSGTLGYIAKADDDGWIYDWPIEELSSTVTPAEFRSAGFGQSVVKAYEVLKGGMSNG